MRKFLQQSIKRILGSIVVYLANKLNIELVKEGYHQIPEHHIDMPQEVFWATRINNEAHDE